MSVDDYDYNYNVSKDSNSTWNCTNDYCLPDEDYMSLIENYIMTLNEYEWALVVMHAVVFVVGLIGNALVCVAVYRNHSMRTVTNYFIVNLALADFLVILFCLAPTVIWDVTETWFMGEHLCKIILYIQTVSVSVSVLTLTFISADRWYAICHPFKFKSTTSRAKTAIVIIWIVSLVFDIPELIVLETKPNRNLRVETVYFMQCTQAWDRKSEMTFLILKILFLYTLPLIFMSITYFQIVRVLWKSGNIPGHQETKKYCTHHTASSQLSSRRGPLVTNANFTTESQLRSRRKAAKMLVAVVIMFAVCYFPVHLLDILRFTITIPQTTATATAAMISHWLCYANSAVNPIIYNIMSEKFRKEFQHTFGFWCCLLRRMSGRRRPRGNSSVTVQSGAYMCRYRSSWPRQCPEDPAMFFNEEAPGERNSIQCAFPPASLRNVSSRYTSTNQRTEIVPLSAIMVSSGREND